MFQRASFVLLAVDVDWLGVSKLAAPVREAHRRFVDATLRAVRPFAPIVRVAYDRAKPQARFIVGQEKIRAIAEDDYGLGVVPMRDDDGLFLKNTVSAAQPALMAGLPPPSRAVIGIIGMNSSECIANTVYGLLARGYSCVVAPESLADYHCDRVDPHWHENTVRGHIARHLPTALSRLNFSSGEAIARALRMPAPVREEPLQEKRPPLAGRPSSPFSLTAYTKPFMK